MQGFRMINAEDCWGISLKPLMESVRKQMGDIPVYFTFDIDGIDPAYCPGTGQLTSMNKYHTLNRQYYTQVFEKLAV